MVGPCERRNETLGFIRRWQFIDCLRDCWLRKGSVPWNWGEGGGTEEVSVSVILTCFKIEIRILRLQGLFFVGDMCSAGCVECWTIGEQRI